MPSRAKTSSGTCSWQRSGRPAIIANINAGPVVLLHPPLHLVGGPIVQERGCQHFNSTGMSADTIANAGPVVLLQPRLSEVLQQKTVWKVSADSKYAGVSSGRKGLGGWQSHSQVAHAVSKSPVRHCRCPVFPLPSWPRHYLPLPCVFSLPSWLRHRRCPAILRPGHTNESGWWQLRSTTTQPSKSRRSTAPGVHCSVEKRPRAAIHLLRACHGLPQLSSATTVEMSELLQSGRPRALGTCTRSPAAPGRSSRRPPPM